MLFTHLPLRRVLGDWLPVSQIYRKGQSPGFVAGALEGYTGARGKGTRCVACPSLKLGQGVLDCTQEPLVLELLPFALPLGSSGLLLFLPPLGHLRGLLRGFGFPLLGLTFGLHIPVAGYGTGSLLDP